MPKLSRRIMRPKPSQKLTFHTILQFSVLLILISLFYALSVPSILYADNAETLPKGVSRFGVNGKFYFPVDERFDPDGDTEDVAKDFNATLGSTVFPGLSLVEAGFGMPTGSGNVGRSVVSFEYNFTLLEFTYMYGITDKLSAGVMVPYWWVRTDVAKAELDTSGATIGKSAALGSLVPIGFLDTVPLTSEDVQNLIGDGLDLNGDGAIDIPGFGYKRIKTWTQSGLSDIEVGLRYQYYKSKNWRLAFTGGARLPTGRVDDPDNLIDFPLGTGAWALLFNFNQDYIGIKNLVLNATFRYELYLPDEERLRVLNDVNQPLTRNKETVDRDLGDVIELEFSGNYTFYEGLSVSVLYKYGHAFKDQIAGKLGFNYKALEDETDYTEHVGIVGVTYSTVPLFQAKKFPIPLTATLSYRNRFAGSNNTLKSQYIGLWVNFFF